MSEKPRHEIPHLHVRPPRLAAPGGPADATIVANRAGLLRLRGQIDRDLGLEDGMASMHWSGYREIDGRVFGLMVHKATGPKQMGEARENGPRNGPQDGQEDVESVRELRLRVVEDLSYRLGRSEARVELTEKAEGTMAEERRRLLEDLDRERARAERLEDELREARRPWWRRVFGG